METTRKWPQPHLRSRCPALLQNCFWRAHREPIGPATPPSSRPPQPLAGGQSEGHFALCHWLRAQSPWLACAPGVAEPTKIQATPEFQPRLPRPVLSLRERKATAGVSSTSVGGGSPGGRANERRLRTGSLGTLGALLWQSQAGQVRTSYLDRGFTLHRPPNPTPSPRAGNRKQSPYWKCL